ncbi:MAG: hypothetical protein K0Q81_834 [Paenibacillus sp.]|nr:hypothetical protein [Paenibacillus sp.]
MIATRTNARENELQPGFISLFFSRTAYLLLAMPLGIFSFTVTVVLILLGIGLMPLGVGFFIYMFALGAAKYLYQLDMAMLSRIIRNHDQTTIEAPEYPPIEWRRVFKEKAYYEPVVYHLFKLPISILQFASVITFIICGFALLFTPAVYLVLDSFGIPMYDESVLTILFPDFTPYQQSFVGTGLGVVFLFIGIRLTPALLRMPTVLPKL